MNPIGRRNFLGGIFGSIAGAIGWKPKGAANAITIDLDPYPLKPIGDVPVLSHNFVAGSPVVFHSKDPHSLVTRETWSFGPKGDRAWTWDCLDDVAIDVADCRSDPAEAFVVFAKAGTT